MIYPPLPDDITDRIARARRLAWWTLCLLGINVVLLYLVMGNSQAMKAAWLEDLLSMIAPALFLGSTWIERREPSRKYPFGMHRAGSLALFLAACALLAIGLLLIYESARALATTEYPTIGSVSLLGREVWMGWLMIAVLAYAAVPPLVLGRLKRPLAQELHDKVLYTDAVTNKADWHTGLAGIAGIVGVAFGLWWADAVAAGLIALSITKDGVKNVRLGVAELLDGAPREIDSADVERTAHRLQEELERRYPGSYVRMRETGRYLRAVVGTGDPIEEGHGRDLIGDRGWRLIEVSRSLRADGVSPEAAPRVGSPGPAAERQDDREG